MTENRSFSLSHMSRAGSTKFMKNHKPNAVEIEEENFSLLSFPLHSAVEKSLEKKNFFPSRDFL